MYLPYKDDKPERAAKIRSEACSDNFRHPNHKRGVEFLIEVIFYDIW